MKACCLSTNPAAAPEALAAMAQGAYDDDLANPWSAQALAIARYRVGDPAGAIELLDSVHLTNEAGEASNQALLSLALGAVGRTEEARAAASRAARKLEEAWPHDVEVVFSDAQWHDWLICRVLLREARECHLRGGRRGPAC